MKRPNLYDYLKVIAILTMIVDHIGYAFFPEMSRFRLVGRIAFPVFLFLVGFNWNYKWRWNLLGWAILVQIPIFILAFKFHSRSPVLNILFGIILWRFALQVITNEKLKIKNGGLLMVIATIILLLVHPWVMQVLDYGSFVILFPLLGYLFRFHYKDLVYNLLYSVFLFWIFLWFTQWVFWFNGLYFIILTVFFALLLCIFFVLWQGNYYLPLTKKFNSWLLFLSKNALLIYIFHLFLIGTIKIISSWKGFL